MSEKRVYPRQPIRIKVDFTSSDSVQSVFALNISAGGIFLSTHRPLPCGSRVVLQLSLPNLDSTVEVLGEVVWSNAHQDGQIGFPEGMGIKFLNLSNLVQEQVGTFQSGRMGNS